MNTKPNSLLISESFNSIQGEGKTTGVPSYFVRLANCNLTCGASVAMVNQFKKGERNDAPAEFKGDLHESGKATWTCDSIPVWAKGESQPFEYLIDQWKAAGVYDEILSGLVHVIWTGGEPAIPMHQKAIVAFSDWWSTEFEDGVMNPFYEIETNGTMVLSDELFDRLDQINCSPKLANSGMTEKQRINPAAIEKIMQHPNYQFKFVISTEEDVLEFLHDFVNRFDIPLQNVCCMPGLDSREDFHERTRFVAEMAIKHRFIGMTRLHVSAWDKVVGV